MIPHMTDAEFCRLADFVRRGYGISLEKKRVLVESRLCGEPGRCGMDSYAALLREVTQNPDGAVCQRMINRLSTNYTYFFREPETLDHFSCHILPSLTLRRAGELRLWCAACASGEEAYTLSMILRRHLSPAGISYRMLATDVNTDMLDCAARGVYDAKAASAIPAEYRGYYHTTPAGIRMDAQLSAPVTWLRHNLLSELPDFQPDIIFCRNVMIYFSKEDRALLAERLCRLLAPGGYLIVSCVESIDLGREKLFVHEKPAVYRKRG